MHDTSIVKQYKKALRVVTLMVIIIFATMINMIITIMTDKQYH